MSRILAINLYIFLLLSIFSYFTEALTSSQLKVKLDHGGVLVGRHLTSLHGRHIRAFLGVPYAEPPINHLRFKAPLPYGPWTGERLAIKNSNKCSQIDIFKSTDVIGSEDCLYLNVFTPEEPQTNQSLPVMVAIHGGFYFMGGSYMLSPKYIMDRDVIYVSINYRIGPLGFLSTETLDCPGNNGLKDQAASLSWIQENIASFGGDPSRVTIFGNSAGASSVTYHMISEKSKGLFHKAISESGTFFNPRALPPSQGEAAQNFRKVAQIVGCDVDKRSWSDILQCLRLKPAENISAVIMDFYKWDIDPIVNFRPVLEPDHADAFLTDFNRKNESFSVPMIIGFNSDEGLLRTSKIVNRPKLLDDLKTNFYKVLPIILNYHNQPLQRQDEITKTVVDFYLKDGINFDKNNFQNFTDLASDAIYNFGMDELLRERLSVKNGEPTYLYLFEHKGSSSFTDWFNNEQYYGTAHADELFFIFPKAEELFITASPTKRDRALREIMLDLWTNFASTSDPTPPGSNLLKWDPVKDYPPKFMRISSKDERDPLLRLGEDYPLARMNFWKDIKPFSTYTTNNKC